MTWMLTAHGRVVDFADPMGTAAALPIETIAHSLAQINRYTGHAVRPISVAEHSLLVVEILERERQPGPFVLLAGLMHDAHECVTNDLASPAKGVVGNGWAQFEGDWEHRFHTLFNLRYVFKHWGAVIKHADLVALVTERRDLLPPAGPAWAATAGVQAADWVDLRTRDAMAWTDWRLAFIDRYHELQFACQLLHEGKLPA